MAKKSNPTEQVISESPIVIEEQTETQVAPASRIMTQAFDLNNANLPDLDNAIEVPLDLMADYWTPESKGESKKVYFDRIEERQVRDQEDPNITLTLLCAFFFEKTGGAPARSISNGSKKLVGLLQELKLARGTALNITYLGRKKNATNQYSSDNWSVRPLILTL